MANKWLLAFLVAVAPVAYADNAQDRQAAISIIQEVVGKCETKGMFACENEIVGAEPLFGLLHLLDDVRKTETAFNEFIQSRYPNEGKARFYVLDASLRLSVNIQFRSRQFVQKITAVKRVANGYDVTVGGEGVFAIRRRASQWYLRFPEPKTNELAQLEPFRLAAALKRSILIYRMLEADMAHLSRAQLEENVSEDLAPVVVAVLGKEKFPALVKWLVKDTKQVIAFYQQFHTVEDMKANIRKTHHLS